MIESFNDLDYDLSWNVYKVSNRCDGDNNNNGGTKETKPKIHLCHSKVLCQQRSKHVIALDLPRYEIFSDCFNIAERDYRLRNRVIRESIRVDSLRECEDSCDEATFFTCKTFAYSPTRSSSFNCDLSDQSFSSLDSSFDLERDNAFTIYERRSGCNNNNGDLCKHVLLIPFCYFWINHI